MLLLETPPALHPTFSGSCSVLVDQQFLVLVGPQEPGERVLLHQGVDPLLGQVKGGGREIHQVPQSDVLGEVVNVDL